MKLGNEYTWIPDSIRYEKIFDEEELMNDKPLDPSQLKMVAVTCKNCGASFTSAVGYSTKCPYCDSAINV